MGVIKLIRSVRPYRAVAVLVVFGAIGVWLLTFSHAGTPTAATEVESGTLSGNAQKIADTTASAGHAVRFNAPAPTSGLPLLGAATYGSTSGVRLSWADFQTQVRGHLQARRDYLDPTTTVPSSFASSPAGPDVANGNVTFFSMKLDPGAFTSGSMDAKFNTFLDSIPAGHQTYLTYWHEPEDDIAKGTTVGGTALTLANWKASVNHMGELIHATHRPELHNMIIFQAPWTFYSGGYGNTNYWDAGFDANVDSVGVDPYASSKLSSGFTNYAAIPDKLGYSGMMSFIHTHFTSQGKTWGITEIGAHEEHPAGSTSAQIADEDQQKAQWITDSWAWAKANGAICYLYFDYNATSGLPDDQSNIILSGSPAETAIRSIASEANR